MVRKKKKNNEDLVLEYQLAETPELKKKVADQLYRKIFRLVAKNAGNFPSIAYGSQEDLIQEASYIFMKCLKKFDTTKGIKFSTYFTDACRYELRRYKDKQRKHVDNSYFLEIDEIIQAKPIEVEDIIDDKTNLDRVEKALYKLRVNNEITDKQYHAIIEEHGFFGEKKLTRKEMADKRGCSLQNVGFLYRKAVDRVRDELEARGQIEK